PLSHPRDLHSFPTRRSSDLGIQSLARRMPSVATLEVHDESRTPFMSQLGWRPAAADHSLVEADRVFVKHGYLPSDETMAHLKGLDRKSTRLNSSHVKISYAV